jgi:hypothetical protein
MKTGSAVPVAAARHSEGVLGRCLHHRGDWWQRYTIMHLYHGVSSTPITAAVVRL